MPFSASWHTLLEELDELPDDAEFITPLSHDTFRVTDVQEHRVVVTFDDTGERRPLKLDQFETLYRRIRDSNGVFEIDRLPPDARAYPAVLSLHPRFEIDEEQVVAVQKEDGTATIVSASVPSIMMATPMRYQRMPARRLRSCPSQSRTLSSSNQTVTPAVIIGAHA